MTIKYAQPLTRAWDRMTHILFQPFDLVKWLVIGFAAFLAGLTDGGGGGGQGWSGINDNDFPSRREIGEGASEFFEHLVENAFIIPVILLVAVAVLALILVLVWLSSRGKFIFLDNVVHNRAAISEPWKRFERRGNSLFMWRVGFALVSLVIVVLILAMMAGPAIGMGFADALGGLPLVALIFGGVLLFAFALVAAYISLFLEAFVIPIMYKYDLRCSEAWRYFIPWLSKHGLHFLLYGLWVLFLWVLFAVVFSVVCLLTCCILLLPYVGTVLLLPVIITYRLLSVEFLGQFDPGFDLFTPLPAPPDAEPEAVEASELAP